MPADLCDALPLGGDGTNWCELEALHSGLHVGTAGAFSRIVPGSSPRSPWRTRRNHRGGVNSTRRSVTPTRNVKE